MSLGIPEAFDYVMNEVAAPKVAFGSGQMREVLPSRGTSKFTSMYTPEEISSVGPSSYDVKIPQCTVENPIGYGGLARTSIRFKTISDSYPGPGEFKKDRFPEEVEPNRYAFNATTTRMPQLHNDYPGPGTYNVMAKRDRRIKFDHSFGGVKKMHPAVNIKCCLYNIDECNVCQEHPEGDYWHLRNKEFLCRQCHAKEIKRSSHYKPWQIEQFKRIRDCSFMHIHDFTYAAYIKMDPKVALTMLTKEAYLVEYFP